MSKLTLLGVFFTICILSGCATSPAVDFVDPFFIGAPKEKEAWYVSLANKYKRPVQDIENLKSDYSKQDISPDSKKKIRNLIQYKLFAMIDEYQANYRTHLHVAKASQDTLFDLLVLGVTAAGAVVGGEAVKAILSATATGITGTKLSISKNWFEEKTVSAIVSQMEALRSEKKQQIFNLMKKSDDDYPLDAALQDMLEYFNDGSIVTALSSLADEAAKRSSDASEALKEARKP